MSNIKLRLFGGFHAEADGIAVTSVLAHSPKGIQVMEYLILNRGRMETTAALTRAMWPDSEAVRPESALKTLISRLRSLLMQVSPLLGACLKTVRGGYQWETQSGVTVDVEDFLRLAEGLHGRVDINNELQTREFRRMMELYRGRLLCDQEQPEWMEQRADLLHRLYLDVVEEYLQKLQSANRQQEIVSICREALDADPVNASLNTRLMEALMHSGRENEAIRQYHHASSLTDGENAATALDEYYTRMLQADKDLQQSLQELRDELTQGADAPGALLCDRIVFGELFRMEQRSLERTQSSITLGIAMLRGLDDSPWQLDAAITTLLGVMVNNLRRGDIVTRLNATQAAFLLPYASEADTGTIVDRLKRSFYLQVPSGCSLTFAFTPISIVRGTRR